MWVEAGFNLRSRVKDIGVMLRHIRTINAFSKGSLVVVDKDPGWISRAKAIIVSDQLERTPQDLLTLTVNTR